MTWRNTKEHYGPPAILLHWIMLLLLVAVYACIELHEALPKGSDTREALKTWHFMLGLTVFVLAFIRLAVHPAGPEPLIVPAPPSWQKALATTAHVLLYVLMIAMPLLGWLLLSASGKPVPFWGMQLPALVAESKSVAAWVEEVHEAGGTAGYFLVALHAAAALYHHYFVRDNTLLRMLPERK
ncbi:MAG: cytochrome b [Azonexus sp.]|nr:cytochrome b [Betaproteobacteria bacterium]MBK8918675.1 cytochrome b [Betaproteobacteria bacterium]MBP6034608.1 cytochrome b [Azonexus sp.]MBP6905148.1 cytochrome b [Azonexus sp.]